MNKSVYYFSGPKPQMDDNFFKVLKKEETTSNKLKAQINIIGSSHYLVFTDTVTKQTLTEILASKLPDILKSKATKVELKNDLKIKKDNLLIWTDTDKNSEISFLGKCSLKYKFDNNAHTAISFRIEGRSLKLKTLHTYPELYLNLWSESTLTL